MSQEPRELKAQDIADYLSGRDDFDLELFAFRALKNHGWVAHHGGTYIDPLLGKRRQFDLRARHCFGANCNVSVAVECKSLSREFPLVVSRVPRPESEASHDVIRVSLSAGSGARELSVVPSEPNRLCLYGPSQMVGKSLTRIAWEQGGKKLISSDVELYDKWAQAIASAAEMITLAFQQTSPRGVAYSFVMPVLLINDGSLWTVDYDEDGKRSEARPVDEAHYFADAEQTHSWSYGLRVVYRMTHLHVYTRAGFESMLSNYASANGTMLERTFGTALRAG